MLLAFHISIFPSIFIFMKIASAVNCTFIILLSFNLLHVAIRSLASESTFQTIEGLAF